MNYLTECPSCNKQGLTLISRMYAVWPMYSSCCKCGVRLRASSKLIPEIVAEIVFGIALFVGMIFWFIESKTYGLMFILIAMLSIFVPQYFGKTEVLDNDL